MKLLTRIIFIVSVVLSFQSVAITKVIKIRYPESASLNCLEGSVLIRYSINSLGKPYNLSIVETTNNEFSKEALNTVSKFAFSVNDFEGLLPVDGVLARINFTLNLEEHSHCFEQINN